jgi:hypothetical protein
MPVGASPIYSNAVYTNGVAFALADGTTGKVVAYGNTAQLLLRSVLLTNLSANPYTFDVLLRRSAVDYQIARVLVPANTGHANGTPAINLIDPDIIPGLDSEPNTKLTLMAADQLVLAPTGALSGTDAVHVVVIGGTVT